MNNKEKYLEFINKILSCYSWRHPINVSKTSIKNIENVFFNSLNKEEYIQKIVFNISGTYYTSNFDEDLENYINDFYKNYDKLDDNSKKFHKEIYDCFFEKNTNICPYILVEIIDYIEKYKHSENYLDLLKLKVGFFIKDYNSKDHTEYTQNFMKRIAPSIFDIENFLIFENGLKKAIILDEKDKLKEEIKESSIKIKPKEIKKI